MNDKIQALRRALDARTQDIAALGRSRELSLAFTSLQQGRMLLGNTIKLLGGSTPYPEASNPKSPRIEPPADVTTADYAPELPEDPVAAVKTVRERLESQVAGMELLRAALFPRHVGTLAESVFEAAYVQLLLAKNWLGMELSAIGSGARDKKKELEKPAAKVPKASRERKTEEAKNPEPNEEKKTEEKGSALDAGGVSKTDALRTEGAATEPAAKAFSGVPDSGGAFGGDN